MIAPFPPTPCRVWLDRDGTPAVDEDRELLVDVIERAYPSAALATLVPRAQWEAVEAVVKAVIALAPDDERIAQQLRSDASIAVKARLRVLSDFTATYRVTFFPEAP